MATTSRTVTRKPETRPARGAVPPPRRSPEVRHDASAAALLRSRFGNGGTMAVLARLARGETVQRAASSAVESSGPATAAAGLLAQGVLRPKLEVSATNDPLEHEADAVADRVMRI
jgi:hypothetical protein